MTRLDLLGPTTTWTIVALTFALLAITIVTRGHPGGSILTTRWKTWAVIAPVWLAAVVWSEATIALALLIAVFGIREYARLTHLPHPGLMMTIAGASVLLAVLDFTSWRATPPLLLLIATLPPLLRQDSERGASDAAFTVLGLLYIPFLATYVWLLRRHTTGGAEALLAVGWAVAISDVGAFTFGSWFGRSPLAAELSPNKTKAGVVGNLIGAGLGVFAAHLIAPMEVHQAVLWALPLVVAVGAVWGDLFESMLKRQFGVKDAGAALPGFGGILDRADSLLVAAPLAYTLLVVSQEFLP